MRAYMGMRAHVAHVEKLHRRALSGSRQRNAHSPKCTEIDRDKPFFLCASQGQSYSMLLIKMKWHVLTTEFKRTREV